MPKKAAPFGDSDRDGIPDGLEQSLGTNCRLAGLTCAELGIQPPSIGARDLILVQVGRSGTEQNWRLRAAVWESTKMELANHSLAVQVIDVGIRDDINVSRAWTNPTNAGGYWVHWIFYDDPATAIAAGSAGMQLYDLITLAERDSVTEERATILHEVYHALLGSLRTHRSACVNEEIGGPGHSGDAESVLYTSPDCDTNEGKFFRLSAAEAEQLRDEPFAALQEMNTPEWSVEA